MGCFLNHQWGWPRKREGKHIQTCTVCGADRECKVQFSDPHYKLTTPGRRPPQIEPALWQKPVREAG